MMVMKKESCLNQNVIKELLFEFYQKGNNQAGDYLIAEKVIQEMVEKLQPFFGPNNKPVIK